MKYSWSKCPKIEKQIPFMSNYMVWALSLKVRLALEIGLGFS
jgi:hypothetical protein